MGKVTEYEKDLAPNLGSCCGCGKGMNVHLVSAIIMLDKLAPVPGTGWGCAECRLPADGAIAVMCDLCASRGMPPRFACKGFAGVNERVPIDTLSTKRFAHDPQFHTGEL